MDEPVLSRSVSIDGCRVSEALAAVEWRVPDSEVSGSVVAADVVVVSVELDFDCPLDFAVLSACDCDSFVCLLAVSVTCLPVPAGLVSVLERLSVPEL